MRLTLILQSMRVGGAERVASILSSAWCEQGHDVTLVTLEETEPFYSLNPAIRVLRLGVASESHSVIQACIANAKRLSVIRSAIRDTKPDVVISFMSSCNVVTAIARLGLGVPIIACEHTDPKGRDIGVAWKVLRVLAYPTCSRVTFLTENVTRRWRRLLGRRAVCMPNPVQAPPSHVARLQPSPAPRLIAMGRLIDLKGFDLLIRAFAIVAPDHPKWTLSIFGEGPKRDELEALVREVGLEGRVALPGVTTNPYQELLRSEVFVLSSRHEGLPMVLCEAMASGVASVSFNCESGPADLITNEVNGLLVPAEDVAALAEALDRVMRDADLRAKLGRNATSIVETFGVPAVLQKWNKLFGDVVAVGKR